MQLHAVGCVQQIEVLIKHTTAVLEVVQGPKTVFLREHTPTTVPPQQHQSTSHRPSHEPHKRLGVVGLVLPTLLTVPVAVPDINAAKLPPPTAPSR